MDGKKLFEKYYSRLMWEGILKAALCGTITGFAVNFILAAVAWFVGFNGFWIAVGVGICTVIVSAIVYYFKLFRPDAKAIARRLDRLGLDERMVTMLEYGESDTFIANLQRQDAQLKLDTVEKKQIKWKIPRAVIIAASVIFALGASMSTVEGLTELGIIKSPDEIMDEILPPPPPTYYSVTYLVEGAGSIEGGGEAQVVEEGKDAEQVFAVGEDGYMFVNWSDGKKNPTRTDVRIQEDLIIRAIFMPVSEGGEGQPTEGEGMPTDAQPENSEPNKNQSSGQESDPSNGAGGKYEAGNQIIDGVTYYRDMYEQYYQKAMELVAAGEDLPPTLRKFIELYFGILL